MHFVKPLEFYLAEESLWSLAEMAISVEVRRTARRWKERGYALCGDHLRVRGGRTFDWQSVNANQPLSNWSLNFLSVDTKYNGREA